jgi:glycosyltransferase involved in cell wall biosynthesis
MRILHIYKDYYPVVGGIENHIKLLAEAQVTMGHEVTVLVANRNTHTTDTILGGVRVIKVGRLATVASTPISLRLFTHLASQRPDIAHLHFPYPIGEMAQLLLGKSKFTIISYHSDVVRQAKLLRLYRPIMLRVLAKSARIIASSQAYLDSSPILPAFKKKCVVIPYGIDQSHLKEPDSAGVASLRDKYGTGPLLLFVGVLRYYKGLQYLLEAMLQVNATLLIVGEGPQGPKLHQQAFQLGLLDRVFFCGRVPDETLPAFYQAADCFVLPACERSEAFGLVQVEALASGLPIVSTELATGTSYVNKNGVSGLVVPPKDSLALANAVNRLIGDTDLRHQLAQGARARADLFQAERMVSQIQEIYENLVDTEKSTAFLINSRD